MKKEFLILSSVGLAFANRFSKGSQSSMKEALLSLFQTGERENFNQAMLLMESFEGEILTPKRSCESESYKILDT